MDRDIKRKKFNIKGILFLTLGISMVFTLVVVSRKGFNPAFKVKRSEIIVGEVKTKSLAETLQVIGHIEPMSSRYIESREGGYIKSIAERGISVVPGDIILELSNKALEVEVEWLKKDLESLDNEFKLFAEESLLREIEFSEDILNFNYELDKLKSIYKVNSELYSSGGISREKLENSESEYHYYLEKKSLLNSRVIKLRSIDNLKKNSFKLKKESLEKEIIKTSKRLDDLKIRASTTGKFTYEDIYIGQSIVPGNILGIISSEKEFIIKSYIDEFYLKELSPGDIAEFKVKSGNTRGEAKLKRIRSEVKDSKVLVEFEIVNSGDLTPGQTINIKIYTGKTKSRLVVNNGAFFKETLGNWIYKVDGKLATRVDIKTGFKDRDYIEITKGLAVGDRVVISGYTRFKEFNKLKIEEQK